MSSKNDVAASLPSNSQENLQNCSRIPTNCVSSASGPATRPADTEAKLEGKKSILMSDFEREFNPASLGRSRGIDSFSRDNSLLDEGLSPFIQALLTDFYQLTMCYGYWKSKRHEDHAVFDLFFRKNPFSGEYTIFCGLEECLRFLQSFRFTESDVSYLRTVFDPGTDAGFFEYLRSVKTDKLKLYALPEGSVVFPKVPMLIVEGPLAVCQLVETTLLNLVNYASLVGTNAARFRMAVGPTKSLLEFGLRRAQGPNGGLCAAKYCYVGGFDGTSNVLAGKLYNIPVKGTQAHSFVTSFCSSKDLQVRNLSHATNPSETCDDFYALAADYVNQVADLLPFVVRGELNEGELTAFCAYAITFPHGFLALIDTYEVKKTGIVNFCGCALALWKLGYQARGVRIDSGDLAYWSREVRSVLKTVSEKFEVPWLKDVTIVASNDINEDILYSLHNQDHQIDAFGVGTHLVTCQKQPALGCVYKLVDIGGSPRMKLSQDVAKIHLPGRKRGYRLFGKQGLAILDLLTLSDEPPPKVGETILCRHPLQESIRAYVTPAKVEPMHKLYFDGQIPENLPTLLQVKDHVQDSLASIRGDVKRVLNPTPYKVSVSQNLYDFLHKLWLQQAPIGQLE